MELLNEVKIGKVVEQILPPKLTWRLTTKVMSGDADHYEDKVIDFYSEEPAQLKELNLYLNMLKAFFSLSWNQGCNQDRIRSEVEKAGEACGYEPDLAYTYYSDYVGPDITWNENRARPDKTKLTWFDENRIEHETKLPFKTGRG